MSICRLRNKEEQKFSPLQFRWHCRRGHPPASGSGRGSSRSSVAPCNRLSLSGRTNQGPAQAGWDYYTELESQWNTGHFKDLYNWTFETHVLRLLLNYYVYTPVTCGISYCCYHKYHHYYNYLSYYYYFYYYYYYYYSYYWCCYCYNCCISYY